MCAPVSKHLGAAAHLRTLSVGVEVEGGVG